MSHHATPIPTDERLTLGPGARSVWVGAAIVGLLGLAAALGFAFLGEQPLRRFYFAYLVSFAFFLSIALGGLFFVLLQHLTRAGWSVSVRRVAELLAGTMPVLAILAIPIAVSILMQKGDLYSWARPHDVIAHDHVLEAKRPWLNPTFFVIRLAIYFGVWSSLAIWYLRTSVRQDHTGDPALTSKMEGRSGPAMLLYALTVTFASFDLLMSLDPHWSSTIFGVYFFSGSAVAIFAALVLILVTLQSLGLLTRSFTTEHYHDLGKFLFGFVFFWGYIAFSQYMLIWYASIPEETGWLFRRGVSTAQTYIPTLAQGIRGFGAVSIVLLVGHFLLPFAALLPRTAKRRRLALSFWAGWLLVFHWLDLYWLIAPEMRQGVRLGPVEFSALVGIGGVFLAALVRSASRCNLRPTRDPRLDEALAFENA